MSEILKESRDMLLKLVNTHLTPKSHGRINHVFNHYADPELLSQLYNPSGPLKPHLTKICNGLNKLLENGTLWGRRSTERLLQDWHRGPPVISDCIQCNQRSRKWLTESIAFQFILWNSVAGLLMTIRSISGLILLTQPLLLPERAQIKYKNIIWTIFFKALGLQLRWIADF